MNDPASMKWQWLHRAALLATFALLAATARGYEPTVPGMLGPAWDAGDDAGSSNVDAIEMGFSPGSGLGRLTDEELALDLDRMASIGATWIRIDLPWSFIEAEEGRYDWSSTDRLIGAALERGLEVDGLIAYAPEWANGAAPSDKYPATDPAEFARFAGEAAARYAPRGVHTWELWNEPNLSNFWAPSPDPVAYAELVSLAASAIRAVDPDAFVISAGLSPAVDDPADSLSPETFLAAMFGSLPTGAIDAVGIHPYSFPADPADRGKKWNTFGRLPEIAALVTRLHAEPLPLWLTEFGAPFDPDEPERQAEIVTEGVACASQMPFAGPIFVYAMRDAVEPSDELPFGIVDADGAVRPSFTALADLLASPGSSTTCW